MSGPADLVARVAARYDGEDDQAARLTASSLARLAWRAARGGKRCDVCREDKPVAAFGPDPGRTDGLARRCRSCEAGRKRDARRRAPVDSRGAAT